MSYDFTADDVFEMARRLEQNGAEFYRRAAANTSETATKEFLLALAAMEDEHEKTFTALQADLTRSETSATVFDPAGEAIHYLHALADTRVFFQKDIDVTSLEEILKAAITAEKDSIVFYLGIKDLVPDKFGKQRLDAIIHEEMGHIRDLSRKLTDLKK